MHTLALLLFLNVVVGLAFVVARALHAKLSPMATPASASGGAPALAARALPPVPTGRQLEEYVQAGLVDLRIMLVQAARRRSE